MKTIVLCALVVLSVAVLTPAPASADHVFGPFSMLTVPTIVPCLVLGGIAYGVAAAVSNEFAADKTMEAVCVSLPSTWVFLGGNQLDHGLDIGLSLYEVTGPPSDGPVSRDNQYQTY